MDIDIITEKKDAGYLKSREKVVYRISNREGAVLKNENETLPLAKRCKTGQCDGWASTVAWRWLWLWTD